MAYTLPEAAQIYQIPPISQAQVRGWETAQKPKPPQFAAWAPQGGMLLYVQVQGTKQLAYLVEPGAKLMILTHDAEPIGLLGSVSYQPLGCFFLRCQRGDEVHAVYFYDWIKQTTTCLTAGMGRCLQPLWSDSARCLAYTSTYPDGQQHRIYLQTLDGAPQCLTPEGQWWPMDWSPDGRYLLLQKAVSNTESYPYLLEIATRQLTPLYPELEQPMMCYQGQWARDGAGIYHLSTRDSEYLRLIYTPLERKESDQICSGDIPWNVERFALAPQGDKLAYSVNENGASRLVIQDKTGHVLPTPALPLSVLSVLSFHPHHPQLAYALTYPASVATWQLFTQTQQIWVHPSERPLTPLQTIAYPSFDGLQIPVFYYSAPQTKPAPVLIDIHGGPTEQARPGLSALFRYWQDHFGLAVLAPNVRGSAGYGQAYMALDDGLKREDAVKDIGALLDWVAEQPELDEKRVCVYGGSYGGYMVLAALVHYGERLAAGIDLMGISHFVTYLTQTAPYRQAGRRAEFGDERDPEMRAFLHRISPLTQASKITQPLLLVHGQHDPRVPASEAEQMYYQLHQQGTPVWYVCFEDEGHGLTKKANGDYFVHVATQFLERYL